MEAKHFCGLDFGTSNSTVAVPRGEEVELVALEGDARTLPSSIFFDFSDGRPIFGRAAIKAYVDGAEGRLMRSLKSVLGSALMDETTRIKTRTYTFKDIIGLIVGRLKAAADAALDADVSQVVLGRPVHFVDDNPAADGRAQNALEEIARACGFREIAFQYEPIAAALAYEQTVREEQYALIADIGGGTSDFSVVRVSPQGRYKPDRAADILANKGVHIGGTDIDRLFSLKTVMPYLGLGGEMRLPFSDKAILVPNGFFVDLATWHRINLLYTPKVSRDIEEVRRYALSPGKIARLADIVEARRGHSIALSVEAAKIGLSDAPTAAIDLSEVERGFVVAAEPKTLNEAIADQLGSLTRTLGDTLAASGLAGGRIDAVFLTGGSTAIPAVRAAVTGATPKAKIIEGDMFGAVGLGLGLDARRKFGSDALRRSA
ncbi:Hsp70 family protein [Methylocystis parvus]|uniref:Hsp70 family protein n=1 Tax=Methylocystis parvus TaxID=134 RepID=A0A6B8M1K6_9HYPH|nr:Hsp70 family protein [Methylocystis parvus]QGM97684.1 Hsp70 family protein [Methylocystis parvus]WBJ98381.1 Hsp70 family protein [Methylocystis parvus OBBP]